MSEEEKQRGHSMDYGPHIILTTPNQATEPSLALT